MIGNNNSMKIQQQQNKVNRLRQELLKLQQEYSAEGLKIAYIKQQQQEVLKNVLQRSFLKQLEYQYHMELSQKNILKANTTVIQNVSSQINMLKTEESKIKTKKNKKTQMENDDQQLRSFQSMERQQQLYLSAVSNKLQKIKEKLNMPINSPFERKIALISQQKKANIQKLEKLKNVQVLGFVTGSNELIPQILGMDLEGLQEVIISCLKFSPITPHKRRKQIYSELLQIQHIGKKMLTGPAKSIFPQQKMHFLPLHNIAFTDSEILFINDNSQPLTPLSHFLLHMDFTSAQHLNVVRYLIRVCLKGAQDVYEQTGLAAIMLPSNLFLNDRFEMRIRNVVFNSLMFRQFKHLISEDQQMFFPPEENPQSVAFSMWSIGVMAYFLCYGTKPFAKYQPMSWKSRQQFFVVNQLQIPPKTAPYEKCRQFIQQCMSRGYGFNFNQFSVAFLKEVK